VCRVVLAATNRCVRKLGTAVEPVEQELGERQAGVVPLGPVAVDVADMRLELIL
jgi:hypothetical protein